MDTLLAQHRTATARRASYWLLLLPVAGVVYLVAEPVLTVVPLVLCVTGVLVISFKGTLAHLRLAGELADPERVIWACAARWSVQVCSRDGTAVDLWTNDPADAIAMLRSHVPHLLVGDDLATMERYWSLVEANRLGARR